MKSPAQRNRIVLPIALSLFLFVAATISIRAAAPSIIITNLPAFGSFSNLSGTTLGIAPSNCAVATFIYIPGAGWWSKPSCPGQPLTAIQTDGSWTTSITTGGTDEQATRVAALLVSTNYNQPCVLGDANLSTNIYAQAIAGAIITRAAPGVRRINFSGYDWWLKTSAGGKVGPGPNYFSDATNNVWLDTNGWLHLRITSQSNQWQCAEIVSARTFGYGSYRFETESAIDSLDPNVVLGFFTWSDDPAFTDRELDVEASRWSNPADANNTQFVIQPPSPSSHIQRYRTPPGLANSTHLFTWQTNRVDWQAQAGSYSPTPAATNLISTFAFTNSPEIPRPGDENIRFNLWLNSGLAPANNQETEVIIKNFNFVPLTLPVPASLTNIQLSGAQFQFTINAEFDRRYRVQSSTNLLDWQTRATLLATNSAINFQDAAIPAAGPIYYRALTLP